MPSARRVAAPSSGQNGDVMDEMIDRASRGCNDGSVRRQGSSSFVNLIRRAGRRLRYPATAGGSGFMIQGTVHERPFNHLPNPSIMYAVYGIAIAIAATLTAMAGQSGNVAAIRIKPSTAAMAAKPIAQIPEITALMRKKDGRAASAAGT